MWRRGPQAAAAAQKRPSTFGRSSSSSKQEPIHILICSANLGNAQPDDASLQAWIPKDGRLFTPQENEHQKYPLATTVESSSSPSSPSTTKNKIGSASSNSLPQSSLFLSHNHESSGDFSLAPEDLPDRSFLQAEGAAFSNSKVDDRQTTPSTTASSTGLLLPHTSMEEQDNHESSSSSSSDESLLRWQQEQRRLQRRQWAEEQRRSNLKSTLLVTRKSQDEQDDRPLSTLMVHEYIAAPSSTPPSRTGSREVAAPEGQNNLEEDDVLPFRKDIVPRKTGVQSLQESDRLTGDLKDWASPAKEEQLLNRKVSLVDDDQDHEDEDTNDAPTLKSPSFAESVGAFIAQSEALIRATSVDEEEDNDDGVHDMESKKTAPLSLLIPKPQVVEDPEEPPSLSLTKAIAPPMERPSSSS